ncbi:MAG: fimbria/pilus outer membrane usher protein, partial [Algiphilus sp.]
MFPFWPAVRKALLLLTLFSAAALALAEGAHAAPSQAANLLALQQREWPRLHFWRAEINGAETVAVAVPVLERRAADYWLRVEDLRSWRLTVPAVSALLYEGEAYVPLKAMPLLNTSVDTRRGVIHLHLLPTAFESRRLTGTSEEVPALSAPIPGALLNYDLFVRDDMESAPAMANALLSARAFHGTRRSDASWTLRDVGGRARTIRLDTAFSMDDHARALRWTAGDTIVRGGALAPRLRFAGIQLRRDFGIRPQQRNAPLPQINGMTELPSTLDLVIDQTRRLRREVPPGQFSIEEPPVLSGAGDATLVITDVLGRQRQLTQSFYVNETALKPGLSDFGLSAGVLREDYGLRSNRYAGILLNGFYRRGLSPVLTAEVIARLRDRRRVAGAALTATLADYAVLDAGLLYGGATHDDGLLGQVALRRNARQWAASLQFRAAEAGFADGLAPDARLRWESVASAGRALGSWRVTISHVERRNRNADDFRRSALTLTTRLGRSTGLTMSLFQQTVEADRDAGVRLLLTRSFGGRRTLSTGLEDGIR